MATVYYTPTHTNFHVSPVNPMYTESSPAYILFNDPEPFLTYFTKVRGKDDVFLKCPGFTEYVKHAYIITAPCNIELQFNGTNVDIIQPSSKDAPELYRMFATHLVNRTAEQPPGSKPLISIPPCYNFYSDESVIMEMLPAFMINSAAKHLIVPGAFDIGKWIRPIDFTFENLESEGKILFRKGEALCAVRFVTGDGSKVELERIIEDRDLMNVIRSTSIMRTIAPRQSLAERYRSAEKYVKAFLQRKHPKNKGKCPFGFKR